MYFDRKSLKKFHYFFMCDDFINKARIDDAEFVKALAKGRAIRKEMNIEYGRIRRQTNLSMLDIPTRGNTPNPPKKDEHIYCCKTVKKQTTPTKKVENQLFVVKNVEMTAIKPT